MITSFGYINSSGPPSAKHVFDVRDLTHNTKSEDFQDRLQQIMDVARGGDSVAIGCRQGKHRSVALANEVAKQLRVSVNHRDNGK